MTLREDQLGNNNNNNEITAYTALSMYSKIVLDADEQDQSYGCLQQVPDV